MRYPQILVFESDGRLATLLRREENLRDCALREPRRVESCLRLLAGGSPSVLVLKTGKDLAREMTLLDRIHWLYPGAATVVIEESGNAAVAGLAWDLGAAFVLTPGYSIQELVEIIRGLLSCPPGELPSTPAQDTPILLPETQEP